MSETYSVKFPPFYSQWMRVFTAFGPDWTALAVPRGCISGGFKWRLLITALAPLAMVVLVACGVLIAQYLSMPSGTHRSARVLLAHAWLWTTPFALLVTFVVIPSVSSAIFSSWMCERYGYDTANAESHYFLREDLGVRYGGSGMAGQVWRVRCWV